MQLTLDQEEIIEEIQKGSNVVITGPGGTGKSTLLRYFDNEYFDNEYLANEEKMNRGPDEHKANPQAHKRKKLRVSAMTGAAAVLINGVTLHSLLGIGLGTASADELIKKIWAHKKLLKRWEDLDMLIIDEISMLSAELFDKLNLVAKRIRKNQRPFGGIQLVLGGDFLQLPCIKGEFCFMADAWEECAFKIFNLTTILRQADPLFQKCLNNARYGCLTEEDLEYCSSHKEANEEKSLKVKPTKIFCFNADVDEINEQKLAKIHAPKRKYTAEIEYNPKIYDASIHQHLFYDITKLCNAQPILQLAVGAQVMLLVNITDDQSEKLNLVNGSRGVVVDFTVDDIPIVLFKNGMTKEIPFHNYEVLKGQDLIGSIWQIPLKLAYAITVHKSQGLTLDCAIIDLRGVFEYGQAYVALSRVKDINGLSLRNATCASFRAHPKAIAFYENFRFSKIKK